MVQGDKRPRAAILACKVVTLSCLIKLPTKSMLAAPPTRQQLDAAECWPQPAQQHQPIPMRVLGHFPHANGVLKMAWRHHQKCLCASHTGSTAFQDFLCAPKKCDHQSSRWTCSWVGCRHSSFLGPGEPLDPGIVEEVLEQVTTSTMICCLVKEEEL